MAQLKTHFLWKLDSILTHIKYIERNGHLHDQETMVSNLIYLKNILDEWVKD